MAALLLNVLAIERPGKGDWIESPSHITAKDGRLTVRTHNRPLEWVLEAISREGRVAVIRADGVGGQQVSVQLQDVPLDEGLRQMLKDHDSLFFYGVEGKAPASLRAVWVYPRGRGPAPVPPEAWASTDELQGRLEVPDPEARARAVAGLVERKSGQALHAVLQALRDGDTQVRVQALYKALGEGVDLPADTLIDLALGDPSPDVRFLDLEGLATEPRQARGLVHHSAAIPPQTNSDSELSASNSQGITSVEGLTSLGPHRIPRPLLSDDLSSPGDLLGIAVRATEALQDDVMPMSEHGGLVFPRTGVA
jgi:hypothetical protein